MSFALKNHLAACLAEKKIRQWQLAWRLRMSRGYVCRLCNGSVQPSIMVAMRIAKLLEKPVEQIFQLADEPAKTISPASLGSAGETNNKTRPRT